MNLKDVIVNIDTINEDTVLYAKRINGNLLPSSEAVLLALTEEELEMKTFEVADRKCPGFSYCMEMFLIKEMVEAMEDAWEVTDIDAKVDRVIYSIEHDA